MTGTVLMGCRTLNAATERGNSKNVPARFQNVNPYGLKDKFP